MKHLITAISIMLVALISKADWQPQASGVTDNLLSIHFINETSGWIVGENGTIIYTSNGGTSWSRQVSNTSQTFSTVDFPTMTTGYAATYAGTIVRTTNGGSTWTIMPVSGFTSIYDIDFIDANTGYLCDHDQNKIARTTNGGSNWQVWVINGFMPNKIKAFNANTAIAAGISGKIYKTTNGGTSWEPQVTGSNNWISAIAFSDINNGYFTHFGLREDVWKTTTGGSVWQQATSPGSSPGLTGLSAVNSSTVYGSGTGLVRRTTNSGSSWETQPLNDSTVYLQDICMINLNVGYAAGSLGKIYKTGNGGIGIQQIGGRIPEDYKLSQNYPNPFNPVTNIEINVPQSGNVKLTVYDVLGREVAVLVNNEMLSAGIYKVDFNASELTSGAYFYRIEAGSFKDTKKMILAK